MRRSTLAAILFLALPASLHAADSLQTPEGWKGESFTFPLAFAPTIALQGTEQVRFPPQWRQFAAEDGFSYLFFWDVKGSLLPSAAIERDLVAYFDGLMAGVLNARKFEPEARNPSVAALHPLAAVPRWGEAYGGEVHTWNAFSRGELLHLNVEVTQRLCGPDHVQVFFAMSKAARARPIWEPLRAVRESVSCGAP